MVTLDDQVEVEDRFFLKPGDEQLLLKEASSVTQKTHTDSYYDTKDHSLTIGHHWLRTRDGRFELKVPYNGAFGRRITRFKELEDEEKIRKHLKLPEEGSLKEALEQAGYSVFCTYGVDRKRFNIGDFIIDLDRAIFDSFEYSIVEVELKVPKNKIKDAERRIAEFAVRFGLKGDVRGKLFEYLLREDPEHYFALLDAWGEKRL